MAQTEKYYALCVRWDGDDTEVAVLDLGESEIGRVLGISVYTSPHGEAQRADLRHYPDHELFIAPVSHEELLDTMRQRMPNSVFYDGTKIAGSVFTGMLKEALGLPIRNPVMIDRERVFPEEGGEDLSE